MPYLKHLPLLILFVCLSACAPAPEAEGIPTVAIAPATDLPAPVVTVQSEVNTTATELATIAPTATTDLKPTAAVAKVEETTSTAKPTLAASAPGSDVQYDYTPLPDTLTPITSENLSQVGLLSRWGRGRVFTVALHPNGDVLAAATPMGIRLYSFPNLEDLGLLGNEGISASEIAWSPQGMHLASIDRGRQLRIWDAENGTQTRSMYIEWGALLSLSWAPDGSKLVTGDEQATMKIWDAINGGLMQTLDGHDGDVRNVAWAPDGAWIASGDAEGNIFIWDTTNDTVVQRFTQHSDGIKALVWSPDSQLLASSAWDNTIRVWDITATQEPQVLQHQGLGFAHLAWSADGTQLAAANENNSWDSEPDVNSAVYFWNITSGEMVNTLSFSDPLRFTDLLMGPNNSYVLTFRDNDKLQVWDSATTENIATVDLSNDRLWLGHVSPDTTKLITYEDFTMRVWDTTTASLAYTLPLRANHMLWSPDSSQLFTISDDNVLELWDAASGQKLDHFFTQTATVWQGISWSPDGTRIIEPEKFSRNISFWDVTTTEKTTCTGQAEFPSAFDWSPDGSVFAVRGTQEVFIHDAATCEVITSIPSSGFTNDLVEWSPDGRFLAVTMGELGFDIPSTSWVEIWDITNGSQVASLDQSESIYSLAWSPDGSMLATGSGAPVFEGDSEAIVTIWDLSNGNTPTQLKGHVSLVMGLTWSPDSTHLISTGIDGGLLVWGVTSASSEPETAVAPSPTAESAVDLAPEAVATPTANAVTTINTEALLQPKTFGTLAEISASNAAQIQPLDRWGQGRPYDIAMNPNGQQLALATTTGLRLLSFPDLIEQEILANFSGRSTELEWSPTGTQLASVDFSNRVQIWGISDGAPSHNLVSLGDPVLTAAWSPDGKFLAMGGGGNAVEIWDATTGQRIKTLENHFDRISALAWSPDGTELASGSWDKSVKIWNVDAGTIRAEHTQHSGGYGVKSLSWSPDGLQLTSTGANEDLVIWEPASGNLFNTFSREKFDLSNASWSPDGRLVVANNDSALDFFFDSELSNDLLIWDVAADTLLNIIDLKEGVAAKTVIWSADSQTITIFQSDAFIRVLDVQTGNQLHAYDAKTTHLGYTVMSPNTDLLATIKDNQLHIWDTDSGTVIYEITANIHEFTWAPNNMQFVIKVETGALEVHNARTGTLIQSFQSVLPYDRTELHWAPDSERFVEKNVFDKAFTVFSLIESRAVQTCPTVASYEHTLDTAWSPNADEIAMAINDEVRIVNVSTCEVRLVITDNTVGLRKLAWSPDGTRIAGGREIVSSNAELNHSVQIWDTANGDAVQRLDGHTSPVAAVEWSSDGQLLLTGSINGYDVSEQEIAAKIWDVNSGAELYSANAHISDIIQVRWMPNNAGFFTVSSDGVIWGWGIPTE